MGHFLRNCERLVTLRSPAAVQTSFSKDGNGGAGPVSKLPLSAGAAGYIDCFWNVALNQYSFGSGICQNHSGECIDIWTRVSDKLVLAASEKSGLSSLRSQDPLRIWAKYTESTFRDALETRGDSPESRVKIQLSLIRPSPEINFPFRTFISALLKSDFETSQDLKTAISGYLSAMIPQIGCRVVAKRRVQRVDWAIARNPINSVTKNAV